MYKYDIETIELGETIDIYKFPPIMAHLIVADKAMKGYEGALAHLNLQVIHFPHILQLIVDNWDENDLVQFVAERLNLFEELVQIHG